MSKYGNGKEVIFKKVEGKFKNPAMPKISFKNMPKILKSTNPEYWKPALTSLLISIGGFTSWCIIQCMIGFIILHMIGFMIGHPIWYMIRHMIRYTIWSMMQYMVQHMIWYMIRYMICYCFIIRNVGNIYFSYMASFINHPELFLVGISARVSPWIVSYKWLKQGKQENEQTVK